MCVGITCTRSCQGDDILSWYVLTNISDVADRKTQTIPCCKINKCQVPLDINKMFALFQATCFSRSVVPEWWGSGDSLFLCPIQKNQLIKIEAIAQQDLSIFMPFIIFRPRLTVILLNAIKAAIEFKMYKLLCSLPLTVLKQKHNI